MNVECLRRETGCRGPAALGGSGLLYGLNTLSIFCERSLTISLHWGTRSCLMPFEQPQSFRKSYSARKKKKRSNKEGGVEEKLQDIQLFFFFKRWETFVRVSMNSSACLIHDQPLFCEVLSSSVQAGWKYFLISGPDVRLFSSGHGDALAL